MFPPGRVCSPLIAAACLTGCPPVGDAFVHEEVIAGDCASCHLVELAEARHPSHGGTLSGDCGTCHWEVSWRPAPYFEHEGWALLGLHAATDCSACHTGEDPQYTGLSDVCGEGEAGVRECGCVSCHAQDAQTVDAPIHNGALADRCDRCHSPKTFRGAEHFDHPAWELAGAHSRTPCNDCHQGSAPEYNGLPHACDGEWGVSRECHCEGCHGELRAAGVGPVGHAEFPRECEQCHNTEQWTWPAP